MKVDPLPTSLATLTRPPCISTNALTSVSPFNAAASGLQIGPSIGITGLNKTGNRTDTLAYQIDTTVVPQLQADTYIGTLNIEAQATP